MLGYLAKHVDRVQIDATPKWIINVSTTLPLLQRFATRSFRNVETFSMLELKIGVLRWNEQCSWLRLIDFHTGIPFRCASTFLLKFSPFYPLALKKRTILNRIKNRLAICRISLIYKRIFCPIMWFVQRWFFTENKILLLFIDLMPFLETTWFLRRANVRSKNHSINFLIC